MPSRLLDFCRRRPLFWFAIAVGGFLAVWRTSDVPSSDISFRITAPSPKIYLSGIVDSEVDVRLNDAEQPVTTLVLKAQRFWLDPSTAGEPVSGKVRVSLKTGEEIRYGDWLAVAGELRAPKGLRNPGGFDQRAWLERQGIRALLVAGKEDRFKVVAHGRGMPWTAVLLRLKAACLQKLARDYPEPHAALLSALFFGVRTDIDDEIQDRFLKTGTLHLLAVSGFNVGFVVWILFFCLKPLYVRRSIRLTLGLAAVWIYVGLVGPQSPVFRAGVMATVWLLGEMVGRRSDALNSLGLSALIVWIFRPLDLFDPGFQLSYAAVIGIVVAVPRLHRRPRLFPNEEMTALQKAADQAGLLFWTSVAAQAATLPICLAHFYVLTPWSALANIPAAFLVWLIFMAGAVQLAVAFVLPGPAAYLAGMIQILMNFFLGVLSFFERLPFAFWATGKLSGWIWLLITVLTSAFLLVKRGRPLVRLAILMAGLAALLGIQEAIRAADRSFRVTFLDVGQGDAIHLRFPDGSNWLVDAGPGRLPGQSKGPPDMGRRVLLPYFRHEAVRRLDRVIITHPQQDHLGGLETVLNEIPVLQYIDTGEPYDSMLYRSIQERLMAHGVPVRKAQAGAQEKVAGIVDVQTLGAGLPEGADNINEASVILFLRHPRGSFLLTGDAGEAAFARLETLGRPIHAEVLKAPHHGAKPGPAEKAFLRELSPRISVISSGEHNLYGHPSREALDFLQELSGNTAYRTDRSGAIRVVCGQGPMRVLDGPESFA